MTQTSDVSTPNTRSLIEQTLKSSLEQVLQLSRIPLAFAHACRGDLDLRKPGGLRVSHLSTNHVADTILRRIAESTSVNCHEPALDFDSLHKAAFKQHIRAFGRRATLLDWLTRALRHYPTLGGQNSSAVIKISVVSGDGCPLTVIEDRINGCQQLTISARAKWVNVLVPTPLAREYLDNLYSRTSRHAQTPSASDYDRLLREQLIGARYAALRESGTAMDAINKLAQVYSSTNETDDRSQALAVWDFLGALQTGLMYLSSAATNAIRPKALLSVGCCGDHALGRGPIALVSTGLDGADTDGHELQLIDRMCQEVNGIGKCLWIHSAQDTAPLDGLQREWDKLCAGAYEQITRVAAEIFDSEAIPSLKKSLLTWMGLVVDRLRNSVHEGMQLPFYWIIADLSQVEDSPYFEFVPWDEGLDDVFFTRDAGRCADILKSLRASIEKRNYSWFIEGKFALVWDAAFPSDRPNGLLALRDSSWAVLVSLVRAGLMPPSGHLIGAIAYKQADGSGGICVQQGIDCDDPKFKHVVSFAKARQWQIASGELLVRIRSALMDATAQWTIRDRDSLVDRMSQALLAISDDPHAGCALAVLKAGEKTPGLKEMGDPWRVQHGGNPLKLTVDQLHALMAMDGATCIYECDGKPAIRFRRLLTGESAAFSKGLKDTIQGAGSRKWSSALAAGRQEIACIITVSQDGPVHMYWQSNGVVDHKELTDSL